jgi:hypothetical protein
MAIRRAALPHRVTVWRRTAVAVDRYQNATFDHVADASPIRARVDTMATEEVGGDRERITYRYLVIIDAVDNPPGPADLLDWLEGGRRLRIDGDVIPTFDGRGRLHHFEAEGQVVTGG